MGCDSVISEIKNGGVKGCLGLDQIQWSGSAGACYEFWKCEPCCGSPCNPKDAIYCMVCWYCTGFCTMSKLYAYSLSQECACVPHILCIWCFSPIASICLRYNLRKKAGQQGNILGDIVCLWCFGCCSFLQELRSVPKSAWDLLPCRPPIPVASPLKIMV